MKRKAILSLAAVIVLSFTVSSVQAGFTSATSTAALVPMDGSWNEGLWEYTISLEWDTADLGMQGVSHISFAQLAILCDTTNIETDDMIQFAPSTDPLTYLYGVDGTSTGEEWEIGDLDDHDLDHTVEWHGFAENDDAITNLTGPVVKFEQPRLDALGNEIPGLDAPGKQGHGTFRFSSPHGPANAFYAGAVAIKSGGNITSGDLSGDLPHCIPEPATMMLLGLGAVGLIRKRRNA